MGISDDEIRYLCIDVGSNFRTLGGGIIHDDSNPICVASVDQPLQFSAGVKVEDVIRFVLREANRVKPTFAEFKSGAGADIFRALDLSEYLEAAQSWRQLRALIVDFNDCDKGHFVKRVKQFAGVCSSGESVLLRAVCYAMDFAWLADELDKKRGTWGQFDRVDGRFRAATAACILQSD